MARALVSMLILLVAWGAGIVAARLSIAQSMRPDLGCPFSVEFPATPEMREISGVGVDRILQMRFDGEDFHLRAECALMFSRPLTRVEIAKIFRDRAGLDNMSTPEYGTYQTLVGSGFYLRAYKIAADVPATYKFIAVQRTPYVLFLTIAGVSATFPQDEIIAFEDSLRGPRSEAFDGE